MEKVDVIVVGGGAAGCFAAIQAACEFPNASIKILERGKQPLSKVKISGGGRCNVTNVLSEPSELSKNYPRGERFLKKAFYTFSSKDMVSWLENKKVPLKLYEDGCFFPQSNDSQTIIDLFLHELKRNKVDLLCNSRVDSIRKENENWIIKTDDNIYSAKSVIITTGGQPKISGFDLLGEIDLKIVPPVPSLFTFNMPDEEIKVLMGIVKEKALVKIVGEKWSGDGPLLITHWGMSGPAVLKTSAFGARVLSEKIYESSVSINWTGQLDFDEVSQHINELKKSNKLVSNLPLYEIKQRLWDFLLLRAEIPVHFRGSDLTNKHSNKLKETLVNDIYQMKGKTTFKEEFVTAGGIDLSEIDVKTMQAKRFPGLYFAGEVLDIDGITGGFNFQAAWTTGFIAGSHCLD
jgi:predicted Rossmann fold flavoprotein